MTRVRRKTFTKKVVSVQQFVCFFKSFCFICFTFIWFVAVERHMEEEMWNNALV